MRVNLLFMMFYDAGNKIYMFADHVIPHSRPLLDDANENDDDDKYYFNS